MLTEEKTKELITEVLVEMMKTKRDVFYEIFQDALEDFAIGQAIELGQTNDFVSEEEILGILETISHECEV